MLCCIFSINWCNTFMKISKLDVILMLCYVMYFSVLHKYHNKKKNESHGAIERIPRILVSYIQCSVRHWKYFYYIFLIIINNG